MGQGHCGLPVDELTALAGKLLDVPDELIAEAVGLEVAEGAVIATEVGGAACLFLAGLYHAARGIAEGLRGPVGVGGAGGGVTAPGVGGAACLFLAGLYHAERGIAERLRALMATP